ncbi:hypothetical protein MP228_005598 [Amoeboaphelidium protococcarum]|nr:hypothetical protein MP228_005598 [Amoeboaphelidium protococcarum]
MQARLSLSIIISLVGAMITLLQGVNADYLQHVNIDAHSAESRERMREELEHLDPHHEQLILDKHMDPREETLHYIALADVDGNQMVDGHELLMFMNKDGAENVNIQEGMEHVDWIMENDDLNHDGFLSVDEILTAEGL